MKNKFAGFNWREVIRLVYPTDPNFGDAMSPMVVSKLSGRHVCPSSMWNADMMAIGSVFYRGDIFMGDWTRRDLGHRLKCVAWEVNRRISRPILVWGSGFLQYPPFKKPCLNRNLDVRALRGRLTKDILVGIGCKFNTESVSYGDPGLLFADLFGIKANPQYDLGIVPHKYQEDSAYGARLKETYEQIGLKVRLIDATENPIDVVRAIASCEKIMSSSLHGLIVADSLGIPNLHMGLSTLEFSQADFELKFRDYYSAFRNDMPQIVSGEDLLSDPKRHMQDQHYRKPNMGVAMEVKAKLLGSFPMPIR